MKHYIFPLLLLPTLAMADSNSIIDFKGRLNWVADNNTASYKVILSDDFTDVTSTTTTSTTTDAPVTTTTRGPVTTTTICRDDDRSDDHHCGCEDDFLLFGDEFSLETSSGGAPMFDFLCQLESRPKGKFKCALPGIKVKVKPYKTPGTHRVKVRYTQSIIRPASSSIRVVMRSTVFGRAFLETAWTPTKNGYKVRAH